MKLCELCFLSLFWASGLAFLARWPRNPLSSLELLRSALHCSLLAQEKPQRDTLKPPKTCALGWVSRTTLKAGGGALNPFSCREQTAVKNIAASTENYHYHSLNLRNDYRQSVVAWRGGRRRLMIITFRLPFSPEEKIWREKEKHSNLNNFMNEVNCIKSWKLY